MGNSKETICGELLYKLMIYEKMNFRVEGRWKVSEQKELLKDLSVMKRLVQLIELKNDITIEEIKNMAPYLDKKVNIGDALTGKDTVVMKFDHKANEIIDLKMLNLIEMAENIIFENQKATALKKIIFQKKRKEQIWFILMVLHNLPRIYLDGEGVFDDVTIMLISPEDAIEYSRSYIEALEKKCC